MTEPLRIGHAERTAAQKALDEHLTAGRLGIEEYADRSAAAANAVVAADLTALFTDLPQPHPQLSDGAVAPPPTAPLPVTPDDMAPPNERRSARNAAVEMGLAVVVTVGLLMLTRQPAAFLLLPLAAMLVLRRA